MDYVKMIMEHNSKSTISYKYPLANLQKELEGIEGGSYILLGAESGVGKTTLADYLYVLNPNIPNHVRFLYYNLELSTKVKVLSFLSYHLENLGVANLNLKELMQNNHKLSPTQMETYMTSLQQQLLNRITFNNKFRLTFNDIENDLKARVAHLNNTDGLHTIVIIDHIALISKSSDTKKAIDDLSELFVYYRNEYNFTFVVIQQFNTGLTSISRNPDMIPDKIVPQRSDFGSSSFTYQDADIVLGGLNPNMYGFPKYKGYDVKKYNNSLSVWYVMKNRYDSNNMTPLGLLRKNQVFTLV